MTLRTRFVLLFTVLAVVPLIGVGAFGYVRALQAVQDLIATQVEEIARNAARQVGERYGRQESNLLLLAGNEETLGLLRAQAEGDSSAVATARATAVPYLEQAWRAIGEGYDWIELLDRDSAVVHRLGGEQALLQDGTRSAAWQSWLTVREPIHGGELAGEVGSVVAAVNPDAVLPFEALETRFGSSGYSLVLDRSTGRVLYHPRHAYWQRTVSELAGPDGWGIDPSVFDGPSGRITYEESDSVRVAYFENLESPPWTIMAAGSVDEFGAPFSRTRTANLVLILVLALAVVTAYTIITRKATDSLVVLTEAADRVGGGNLEPALPDTGKDEVGRLTNAFRLMTDKLRESREQLEASRQMAAVGEFASQISHEIRNPLTSLNLNLQGLGREVDAGSIPGELARPIELCLREVQRLDSVVSGVLSLARPRKTEARPCSVHGAIEGGLELMQAQFAAADVKVETALRAPTDTVVGDAEALESVFTNLFRNAVEAMPDGGRLTVSSEAGFAGANPGIRVRVMDDGPGIPAAVGEQIFTPFFTTKKGGTGLGLSLAARVVEDHHGIMTLAQRAPDSGSEFVIDLPLAAEERNA